MQKMILSAHLIPFHLPTIGFSFDRFTKTMKNFLIASTVFFVLAILMTDGFAQCNSYVLDARKQPPLQQDTTKTIIINSQKYFVFADTNRTYISKWDVADTSLYDGNWVLLSHNNLKNILLQVTYKNKLIDGKLICRQDDGTILEELSYSNGKLDGQQKEYFENGQIDELKNYKDGLKEGEQKSYWRDGSIQSISFYKNGQPTGEHKHFHKNGKQSSIAHYDEYGRKQGEFYEWDEKGRLTKYSSFKDNLPIGTEFGFWDGKPTYQKYFENEKLKRWVYSFYTTPQEYFETKRKKKIEYNFEKTEISFKEEAIWTDTIITVRKYYPSGQLQSEEQIFFAGQKDCKDIYKKTGTHKFWTANGKLEKELQYKDDKLIEK